MSEQQNPLAAQLETAAATLTSDAAPAEIGDNGVSILRYHGYDDGNVAEAAGRARMLRAAAKLHRLFLLPVPDAAGVVFFGGAADPAILAPGQAGAPIGSLASAGLSPQRAVEACVGEGIEYLSQFVGPRMRSNLVCSPIIATLTIRTPAGSFPPRSLLPMSIPASRLHGLPLDG